MSLYKAVMDKKKQDREKIPQYLEFVEMCNRRKVELKKLGALEAEVYFLKSDIRERDLSISDSLDIISDKNESIDYLEHENDKLEAAINRVRGELEAKDVLLQQIGNPPEKLKELEERSERLFQASMELIYVLQGIKEVCNAFQSDCNSSGVLLKHVQDPDKKRTLLTVQATMELVLDPILGLLKKVKEFDQPQTQEAAA